MATQAEIRQMVRDKVYSLEPEEHPFIHQINGAIATTGTTAVIVDDGTYFNTGDIIEFLADGEQCYVVSVATNTLTVIRGFNGTTAATHADNEVILKNPITLQQIDQALTDTLADLTRLGIYGWATGSITLVAGQDYYDLTDVDIIDHPGVVSVYYPQDTTLLPVPVPFWYNSHIDSNVSTSGQGITVLNWGEQVAGESLYYTYAQRYDAVTDVQDRHLDLLVSGAAYRVMLTQLGPRAHDPGARTNDDSSLADLSRLIRDWRSEYILSAKAEQAVLKTERSKVPGSIRSKRALRFKR